MNASQSPGVARFVAASRSSSRASPAVPLGTRESDATVDAAPAAAASQGHVRVAERHSSSSRDLCQTRAVVVEVDVETVVAFAFASGVPFKPCASNRSPLKSIDPNATPPLGREFSPVSQSHDAHPARPSTAKGVRALESVAVTSSPSETRSKPSKRLAASAAGVRHAMVDAKLIGANGDGRGDGRDGTEDGRGGAKDGRGGTSGGGGDGSVLADGDGSVLADRDGSVLADGDGSVLDDAVVVDVGAIAVGAIAVGAIAVGAIASTCSSPREPRFALGLAVTSKARNFQYMPLVAYPSRLRSRGSSRAGSDASRASRARRSRAARFSKSARDTRQHAASNSSLSRPVGAPRRSSLASSHTVTRTSARGRGEDEGSRCRA